MNMEINEKPIRAELSKEKMVDVEQLKTGEEYIMFNSLDIPGDRSSVSIEPGAKFRVLPGTTENTHNTPLEEGVYLFLDFGSVIVAVDRKKLGTSYILKSESKED